MKSATLDTNLLLEYWKSQNRKYVVEKLIALADAGRLDLAVTGRIRDDIPHPPLSDQINNLPKLNISEMGAVFRFDMSVWDGQDMLGDDLFLEVSYELNAKLDSEGKACPDWRDWDHLHAHFLTGRDVFLTWDRRVLDVARQLRKQLQMVVTAPEDFLASYRPHENASRAGI